MENKRVLIVTQEMKPYLIQSNIAQIARQLPQYAQEQGMEIRVLMPRFGNINERRHRLHEVVRLSGINISIGDEDYPLVIKVASLPGARIQVYFLDNEDLFKRKAVFYDDKKQFFEDNAERSIFFCKGVMETVKKFGWAPDIIHCHGWMTSLIPLYTKTIYKKDPVFKNSKVIYSVYDNEFEETLGSAFGTKIKENGSVKGIDLAKFEKGDNATLYKGAISYADAIVRGSENIDKDVEKFLMDNNGKPVLTHPSEEEYLPAYKEFYTQVLEG